MNGDLPKASQGTDVPAVTSTVLLNPFLATRMYWSRKEACAHTDDPRGPRKEVAVLSI